MTKTHAAHLVVSAVAVACGQAHALGFGRVDADVPLGQPLAFGGETVVQLGIEAGS